VFQTTLPTDTKIRQARLVYEEGKYYLHLATEVKNKPKKNQNKNVMSVDILHKITSNFLQVCLQKGIKTIVIGDVTNIRERVEGNDNANQKIHQ